jgi:hypothetical protein
MTDHLIGLCHLGQVFAGGTGLLPLLPGGSSTFGPGRCRRLREPLGRGGHRRVARIPTEALLQVGQLRLEHGHLCPKQSILGHDLLVGRSIGREIAGWNSPRYARWSPWWWIRPSGDLNSYALVKVIGSDRRRQ